MLFEHKKEHVLRCIKLGMELYKAQLIAECTDEEIDQMNGDELFQKRIEQEYALAEKELLEQHNEVLEMQKLRGIGTGIQWKLSKLNPDKWDSKDNSGMKLNINEPKKVILEGVSPNEKSEDSDS